MEKTEKACPPWVGRLMVSPLRKLMHNPNKILAPFIKIENTILEIGPGMGFFSIPMANLTGKNGKIYCVDIQKPMLNALSERAKKYNVSNQIITLHCLQNGLNIGHLKQQIDFILLFAVVHEIPDKQQLFKECYEVLKPDGKILFSEPKGHVKQEDWDLSLSYAQNAGFNLEATENIRGSISMVLVK